VVTHGKAAAASAAGRVDPHVPVLDYLGASWLTSGIGVSVSKASAALGASLTTIGRIDGRAVSLVTRDALLHQKGEPA